MWIHTQFWFLRNSKIKYDFRADTLVYMALLRKFCAVRVRTVFFQTSLKKLKSS